MNIELVEFARSYLKENLELCSGGQQHMFKRMYSHKNLDKPLDQVVDDMPEEHLNHAMTQVGRTVAKNVAATTGDE